MKRTKKFWTGLAAVLSLAALVFGAAAVTPDADSAVKASVAEAKSESTGFSLTMLDVGQGLSVLVEADGEYLLYDGGPEDSSSYVVSYLKNQGVTDLSYLVASHYDSDHIAGLVGVLNTTPVETALTPDYVADTKIYSSFETKLSANGASDVHPLMGDVYTLGSAKIQVVGPAYYTHEGDNDNSIALRITYGNTSFLMTGDAEETEEYEMVASGLELDSDVYIVGHHGSASSSTTALLNAVTPSYAMISVGAGNSYGHPTQEALSRLAAAGAAIYRTDLQGAVTVTSDGSSLSFSASPTTDYTPGTASSESSQSSSGTQAAAVQSDDTTTYTYVLNTNTKKFHLPTCSSVSKMKDKNKAYSSESRETLISEGYSPCKICNP